MSQYALFPGTISLASAAIMLFGADSVSPGVWLGPVFVTSSPEDLEAFLSIVNEISPKPIRAERVR